MNNEEKDIRISEKLCLWYKENKRDLPWRHTQDPYKIWLSEIILQQTKVNQGLSYYMDFVQTYPTIQALAKADEDEVLKHWQGLGYYSRARNMHHTAQIIVRDYEGVFPHDFKTLISLKGIGHYTASAIASFAFHLPYPVLDGNVYRILARLFNIEMNILDKDAPKLFLQLAESILDERNAACHNQAVMEFGALQCKPQQPDCLHCPIVDFCMAYAAHEVENRPIRIVKSQRKVRFFYYICLFDGKYIWLRQRKEKDIWQHLWEFPIIEASHETHWDKLLIDHPEVRDWLGKNAILYPEVAYRHILTHQEIHAIFFSAKIEPESLSFPSEWNKIDICEIDKYAVSRLTDKFLKSKCNKIKNQQ